MKCPYTYITLENGGNPNITQTWIKMEEIKILLKSVILFWQPILSIYKMKTCIRILMKIDNSGRYKSQVE